MEKHPELDQDYEFIVQDISFPEMPIIYIPLTLTHEEMLDTGQYFMKLGIYAFSVDGKPTGRSFKRILNQTETHIELECCFEMEATVPEGEGVFSKVLPAIDGKFAGTRHIGNRGDLPKAYVKMYEWFKTQDLARTGEPLIEFYPNNKHMVPVAELITDILWPVK